MHLLMKIEATLDELFASFKVQQLSVVNDNLQQTLPLLDSSAHQLLTFMQEKEIEFNEFFADKCLPLTRFYLAPNEVQQQLFLSREELSKLFTEIPAVEAYVFKNKIEIALQKIKLKQTAKDPVIEFPNPQKALNTESYTTAQGQQSLSKSPKNPKYLDYFYQLQDGNLVIANNQESSFHN